MRLPPADVLARRADSLVPAMQARGIDVLVVTSLSNIAYLTGFFASAAALLVTPAEFIVLSDGRYSQALAARGLEYTRVRPVELIPGASYDAALVDALGPYRGLRVGVEASHLTVNRYRYLTTELAMRGWATGLIETADVVEALRVRKDGWELARLRDGASRLSDVAKYIMSKDLVGLHEYDVAGDIDAALRRAGFARPAFDTIVAGGPNAALPHGRPAGRRIERGELVLLDFGGVLDGYCTDLTRTVVTPPGEARARRVIEQVVDAQAAAFAAVAPGRAPDDVDGAARGRLEAFGLGAAFTHGTGHGLGLDVHEAPRVSRRREGVVEPALEAGMVLTLEPGVYLPGWGGARIEDDVLVTEDGAEWLTDVPRLG
jgi:Xaa-Pro aminopeptidase